MIRYDGTVRPETLTSNGVDDYINIGYQPIVSDVVEIKIKYLTIDGTLRYLGTFDNAVPPSTRYYIGVTAANKWRLAVGLTPLESVVVADTEINIFKIEGRILYKNDVEIIDGSADEGDIPEDLPFLLFALNTPNGAQDFANVDLYYFKVWRSGALIRHFVPTIDNQIQCLVTGQRYLNQGAGSLVPTGTKSCMTMSKSIRQLDYVI